MHILVARGTGRNQVPRCVISRLAAIFLMVNLEARRGADVWHLQLSLQHFLAKVLVRFRLHPEAWLFRSNPIHDAF